MPGYERDFREMVASARRFLDGEIPYMEFYATVRETGLYVHFFAHGTRVRALMKEWIDAVETCRHEWGTPPAGAPTEDDLRAWLKDQV